MQETSERVRVVYLYVCDCLAFRAYPKKGCWIENDETYAYKSPKWNERKTNLDIDFTKFI